MGRPLLSAHEIVRAIGTRTILRSVSLAVDDRSRTALVGPNGSGKSTLMRILAGELEPDGGCVVRGRGAAVLYLPQLDATDDRRPVRAVLHERLGVATAAARMDALAAELASGHDVIEAHGQALEDWLARGGADVDARLDQGGRGRWSRLRPARPPGCGALRRPARPGDARRDRGRTHALETALAGWPGALVVATHDARLREGLELDRVVDVGSL